MKGSGKSETEHDLLRPFYPAYDIHHRLPNIDVNNPQLIPLSHIACGMFAAALLWPWGELRFLPSSVHRKSYGGRKETSWWPQGVLTAAARRTCSSWNNREGTVRPPSVSLRPPRSFWSHESYDHHNVPLTFVTTITAAHKNLRFLIIVFTNRRPHNRTATVRRQHEIWPKLNQVPILKNIIWYNSLGNQLQ